MSNSLTSQKTGLRLANLIIGGVNRSATTSLFTYLSEHPQICPSTIKETNYFLPTLNGTALEPIKTYAAYFKQSDNKTYLMEASPRYIFGGARIARTIHDCLGPIRIMFVLRDPITRMLSYFNQRKRSGELPVSMTIDDYARRALEELPAVQALYSGKSIEVYRESIFIRGLAQGLYVGYLEGWYEVFPETIHVSFFEDISRSPQSAVEDVCRWLGLDTSVYRGLEFTRENRTIEHKSDTLFKFASRINDRFEPFWRKHKKVKRWIRDIYLRLNEERRRDASLSPSLRAELERAYALSNQKLRAMLCQKGYRNLPAWLAGSPEADSRI
jgi:sulfotransferase family protein